MAEEENQLKLQHKIMKMILKMVCVNNILAIRTRGERTAIK